MRVVNKKLWVITITLLVVIECVFTYLSVKSFNNKDIAKIKEENKVNKEMFSMYVENKDGEYEEYTDSEYYPIGLKYYFNEFIIAGSICFFLDIIFSMKSPCSKLSLNESFIVFLEFSLNRI